MATLEQIAAALQKADAAGNVEDARALAKAYREMQAQQSAAPDAPASPSPAAQDAFAAASAVNPLNRPAPNPQASSLPGPLGPMQDALSAFMSGAAQGMTFGWGDELTAGLLSPVEASIAALQGKGFDLGKGYQTVLEKGREIDRNKAALSPTANMVGEIAGALPAGGMLGGQLGMTGPLAQRMAIGFGTGAGQGALYGAGKADENKGDAAMWGGALGGAVGGLTPAVTSWLGKGLEKGAQRSAVKAAAKAGESADELKTAASQAFEAATGGNPIGITTDAYGRLLSSIKPTADKLRLNTALEPQSVGLMQKLMGIADDLNAPGSNVMVDLKDLHILRQTAQQVAQTASGADKLFASTVISKLDDFLQTLKPVDIAGGMDPTSATKALFEGISGWNKANKVSILEEAIRKGEAAKSGAENGIRGEMLRIVRNKKVFGRFSPAEQQAIRDVADGNLARNLLRLLGKFGFSKDNMMGGTIGGLLGGTAATGGNPLGGVVLASIGTAARPAAEALTKKAADTAVRAIGSPVLPVRPPPIPNTAGWLEKAMRGLPAAVESQR